MTSSAQSTRAGGFTLLELMVTLVLMGVVLGAGIGAITSFDPSRHAARGVVMNTLRQARNEAIAFGAAARVEFDPGASTMRSIGFRVAGTWRFEGGDVAGSAGLPATVHGLEDGRVHQDGFIGDALDLARGAPRARVEIDLTGDPIHTLRRGFRVSFAVRPEPGGAEGMLLDYGGVLGIEAVRGGAIDVRLATSGTDEYGRAREGERIRLLSPAGVLRGGRWAQVELRYDRERVSLHVNGVAVAERLDTRPVWQSDGRLTIGGGRRAFQGRIDDLVLSVVRVEQAVPMPGSTLLTASEPFDVRFDETGQLDAMHHAGPVVIGLEFGDGRQESVEVMPAGTIL